MGRRIETGTGSDRMITEGSGEIKRERKKETVTDSTGEKPVLVSRAPTADVMK